MSDTPPIESRSAVTPRRVRVRRWLFQQSQRWRDYLDEKPDWAVNFYVPQWAEQVACVLTRTHYPIGDQCGDPAHDYCLYCGASTPGRG